MSLLSAGVRCSACTLVDFLPLTCPRCSQPFCSAHIHSHLCVDEDTQGGVGDNGAGPSRVKRVRSVCEVEGCERETIESIAGFESSLNNSSATAGNIAREVRCPYCQGAFCVSHRAQISHSCSAPLAHDEKYDAFLARRAKAREVIAQHFPEHAGRVIPKPPPARDVIRKKPDTDSTVQQPFTVSEERNSGEHPIPVVVPIPKTKSKSEKLWDLHLRKLRAGARALDAKSPAAQERRFFEYAVDESGEKVRKWGVDGKWVGKTDRVWVVAEIPIGKVMDLIIAQERVIRPKDLDPNHALGLVNLFADPNGPRTTIPLDLSNSASDGIVEGSLVVLVRGSGQR